MSKQNKSAKDLAFDKERAKYKKQIRELSDDLYDKNKEINHLKEELEESNLKITELKDWIERLLEYTELSEEDANNLRDRANNSKYFANFLDSISSITKGFPYF